MTKAGNLKEAQAIFMLGIAGSGMRGLAWLLQTQGKKIVGTDERADGALRDRFKILETDQTEEALADSALLIYSDAVPESHALRLKARELNIPQLGYHQALGQFSNSYQTLAVTGTHGKSSTTAFLAHILIEAGYDPSVLIGADVTDWPGGNARLGQGKYFVVEADEYREHFLELSPAATIITNIDYDHPDYFKSTAAVAVAYDKFLQRVVETGTTITPRSVYEQYRQLHWPADAVAVDITATTVQSPIIGQHMRSNAALAIALAAKLGIDPSQAEKSLQSFSGLSRRMETLGQINDLTVISDYGHHPAEISATLKAVREANPNAKILAVFEVHMLERLQTFFNDFVQALMLADGLVIYPPFSPTGRESRELTALTEQLYNELLSRKIDCQLLTEPAQLREALENGSKTFNLAIAFTAGSLDQDLRATIQ